MFLRSNSPCTTYLFLFSLQEEQILKSSKPGRPWDVVEGKSPLRMFI